MAAGIPRWVTLIDEALFVIASIVFIKGSLDFFPDVPIQKYVEGCEFFIGGSAVYLILAVFATYEILEDARLGQHPVAPELIVEQILYLIGSGLFVAGTVLFTPPLPSGDASVMTRLDGPAVEILKIPMLGRTLYLTAGQVPEIPETSIVIGDELFVLGSVLFSVAAFVSALSAAGETGSDPVSVIRRRTSVASASLFELGGVAFVVGTLGFIPAEVLGITACPDGPRIMERAGAELFLIGSVLYTMGSLLNFGFRAWLTYRPGSKQPVVFSSSAMSGASEEKDIDEATGIDDGTADSAESDPKEYQPLGILSTTPMAGDDPDESTP